MRIGLAAAALSLLTAAHAHAAEEQVASAAGNQFRAAVAIGGGWAYNGLGLHLELGAPHATIFFGTGLLALQHLGRRVTDHYDLAVGARYYSGDLDRFFFSGQALFALPGDTSIDDSGSPILPRDTQSLKLVGLTAGWRWRWGRQMLELGGGLALLLSSDVEIPGFPSPDISLAYALRF